MSAAVQVTPLNTVQLLPWAEWEESAVRVSKGDRPPWVGSLAFAV